MRAVLISFFLLSFCAKGQLIFEEGTLSSSFDRAKTENKQVFLFIYADGCSHCDAFKETFKVMNEGAAYFNENFVNAKVEVNSEEGKAVRFKWGINVMSTPLFTFWSGDTTLLSFEPSTDQLNNEEALLRLAVDARNPANFWEAQKTSYTTLNDIGKLAQLAFKARIARDTLTNLLVLDRYVAVKGKTNLSTNEFMLIKQAVMDVDSPLFTFLINNKAAFISKHGEKEVNGTIENIVMFSLMSSKAEGFDPEKIKFLKTLLASIGLQQQTIKARFLLYETNKFFAEGQNDKAIALFEDYYKGQASIHPNEAAFIKKHLKEKTGVSEMPSSLAKLIESKIIN